MPTRRRDSSFIPLPPSLREVSRSLDLARGKVRSAAYDLVLQDPQRAAEELGEAERHARLAARGLAVARRALERAAAKRAANG